MFRFFSKPLDPIQFSFHTDIHCHVVPGIDDGSPDAGTSADLIERMQGWDVSRILASPHVTKTTFENSPETIGPAMAALRAELSRRGNDIEIDHHAEYRIDELLMDNINRKSLMTLPNDYILIENSFIQEPWNLEQLVFDLQIQGLRPILAHPERYAYYHSRPKRFEELHNMGLMLQINLLSLADAYGGREAKIARELLRKGLVDFIGTDLHNHRHAEAINAYLTTRQAREDMAMLADCVKNDEAFVQEGPAEANAKK